MNDFGVCVLITSQQCLTRSLTCGLYHSFQDDNDLKVLLLQLGLGHVPEGRMYVDLVGDHQR